MHQLHCSSIFLISKVSWRLTPPATLPHHIRHVEAEEVDGFYILYRPSIGRPPGFTSITVLHAAATRWDLLSKLSFSFIAVAVALDPGNSFSTWYHAPIFFFYFAYCG